MLDKTDSFDARAALVSQVQAMVERSGNPIGFDAAAWVTEWLNHPLPALNGRLPLDLLDTPEGFDVVQNILKAIESGAYI